MWVEPTVSDNKLWNEAFSYRKMLRVVTAQAVVITA